MAKPHSVREIVTDPGCCNTGAPQAAVLRPSAPSWPGGPGGSCSFMDLASETAVMPRLSTASMRAPCYSSRSMMARRLSIGPGSAGREQVRHLYIERAGVGRIGVRSAICTRSQLWPSLFWASCALLNAVMARLTVLLET